jgi:hypothetical protein
MTASEFRCGLFALLLTVLASAAVAAGARAQNYDDGMRAYDAGDLAKALEIWGPVAENGDAVAQYSLGKLLENGGAGVPRDLVAAARWYQRSASQGVAAAQNNLGLMYAQGRGVPQDVARAAKFWRDAGAKDHLIAQFNLGLAYFRGEGVAEDRVEALRWFRRAGELGLADAQYALGQIIRLGLAGAADEAEALYWYQLAAAQDHVKAETQAQQLRDARVVARVPAGAAAAPVAASAPPPPPKPVAKPVAPEPEPETLVIAAPEPEPETLVIAAPEPVPETLVIAAPEPEPRVAALPKPAPAPPAAPAATPKPEVAPLTPAAAGGAYSAWLISFKDAAEARAYLAAAQAKHPELFAAAPGAVAAARPGRGGTFHRVLAGGLPSRAAARDLCRRLRAAEPGAFCKVLMN